jgi:hypothetical protein
MVHGGMPTPRLSFVRLRQMRDEMRAARLAILTGAVALLGACASNGIRSEGGDVFVLETNSLSGSRAVERGLADARDFCVANGRQLVVQDSRIGSGNYQLQFRCVAPFGTARAGGVDPLMTAAASPVAPAVAEAAPRRRVRRNASTTTAMAPVAEPAAETPRPVRRTRRAQAAEAAYVPPADSSTLQPMQTQPTLASRFARPEPAATEAPALPPVATTPLFNPRGASFPAPVATPVRRIPADNGPFAPIEQAASAAQPVAAQPVAMVQPAAAPRPAISDALPPIQLPPAATTAPSGQILAAPSTTYGASVPSPQVLPGASSALTPIASPLRPMPAAVPAANPSQPPPGFFNNPAR